MLDTKTSTVAIEEQFAFGWIIELDILLIIVSLPEIEALDVERPPLTFNACCESWLSKVLKWSYVSGELPWHCILL